MLKMHGFIRLGRFLLVSELENVQFEIFSYIIFLKMQAIELLLNSPIFELATGNRGDKYYHT